MVTALHCLSYVSAVVGLIFVLLSLASGLLYIAEVIEEHSGLAKTTGKRLIYCIIVFYGILYWVDDLPVHLVAVGVTAHFIYLTNFRKSWPTISLTSLSFILSCIFVLLSHYLSFRHFSAKQSSANHHYGRYNAYNHRRGAYGKKQDEGFLEVATFFAVCVWLVPFYLFLSLSANDNVLPSSGETPGPSSRKPSSASSPLVPPQSPTLGRHQRQRSSMMKSALSSCFSIVPSVLRPSSLSSNLNNVPVSTGSGGSRKDSTDRLLRSPSPTIGFQPFASTSATRGGAGSQREGLLVSSSPTTSSFFSSGQTGPWGSPYTAAGGGGGGGGGTAPSQPSSPSLGASYPPPGGGAGGRGLGLGMGMGMGGMSSPALRALNPPGMPPRRHTTAGDEGASFVSSASAAMGGHDSTNSMLNRSTGGGMSSTGPIKRRGTGGMGEPSSLR
ncbi:Svp26p [Sporobolomyces salmoneus]|uniref:Svp26p n=1 Tax=Sporobolomyces salmoneus TaxID=183962 RepID=UPI00316FF45B